MRLSRWLPLVAIILLGFGLRLYHLQDVPLRGDEAFTAQNWAGQPLSYSLSHIATIEPHPPLTYVLFRGWGLLVGTGELAMRLLPALFNLLGIPALYVLGKRWGGNRLGLVTALLWAVHPFEIWHAQDARNYAIWAGLSAVTLWAGLRSLETRQRRDLILYFVLAVITSNVFYTELFTLVALGLYGVLTHWRRWWTIRWWLLAQALAALSAVASFVLLQGRLVGSGTYSGTIGGAIDPAQLITRFVPFLNFGETLPDSFVSLVWPFIVIGLIIGWIAWWRTRRQVAYFLAIFALLPLALMGIVSTRFFIFLPRYILSSVPAYILLVSGLTLLIPRLMKARLVTVIVLVGWGGVIGYSLVNYFSNPQLKSVNWPALTAYLRNDVEPDDLVIQLSADAAFGYYYDSAAPNIALPASPRQTEAEITTILEANQTRPIWLVGQTFPDWPNAGVVEGWMQAHMQLVHDTQTDGLRIQEYMPWMVNASEITGVPLAEFDDTAALVGVRVFEKPEPTGDLVVWLYWKPIQPTPGSLKIFVHLAGGINPVTGSPLWSQDDQYPQNGRLDSSGWPVEEIFRDVYHIPLNDVPPGHYDLLVGFYDPATNERVNVGGGDSYLLRSIHLGQ